MVDLQMLEDQARKLYLHRFVAAVQEARQEFGRFLTLRAGDELAIRLAQDGSGTLFDAVAKPVLDPDAETGSEQPSA